jgi:hypothetical protein
MAFWGYEIGIIRSVLSRRVEWCYFCRCWMPVSDAMMGLVKLRQPSVEALRCLFLLISFLIQKMASCVNMDTGGLLLVPFDAFCRDASIGAIFIRGLVCFGFVFWKLEGRKNSELVPI